MKVNIIGKNMEISDYLRDVVAKKTRKIERYFKPDAEMQIKLAIEKSRHIAEVTIVADGVFLRGEEATGDMYSSIDAVLKKIERQMRKYRTKLSKRLREDAFRDQEAFNAEVDAEIAEVTEEEDEYNAPVIVRNKKFVAKPMEVEDAVVQMELLGHSFFVYRNPGTSEVNVVYRRADGNYGVIEPII
ncbi:MAG: ribosome-associated translation inhibitor RaiA [Clostridia bacterium]|nr:ribosome-associated translation inhibitor RaiA [Clostridia bacterium]